MKDTEVNTIGDLINFLLQFDPNKRVAIYDYEYGQIVPFQHIEIEDTEVIFYP